jgi:hypothetical protein
LARLYSNENFPLDVVQELRRLGHDVGLLGIVCGRVAALSKVVGMSFGLPRPSAIWDAWDNWHGFSRPQQVSAAAIAILVLTVNFVYIPYRVPKD